MFLFGLILSISFQANATKWIVNVQNFSFSPSNLPGVAVGDTIKWVWINGSHTTTSTTIPGSAASWDEPITSSNTFYEYPVTAAGSYNYVCTPHAGMGMVGSFTAIVVTPVLVSIVPNQALQGASFLATITGSNTNFSGSPSVNLSYSNNGFEIINATSVTVISPTVIHAQFTIPPSASVGLWDVHVNSLVLDNGFTVNEAIPAITFMDPNFAHQGDSFNGTIYGENTTWSGNPSVSLSFSGDPGEIITGTNVVVVNNTQITADFSIPSDASIGNYSVHVDDMEQANGFTVLSAQVPALAGIDPDNGEQGYTVSSTITAENTSFEGTSPAVSLSLHANPGEIVSGSNVVVVNNTTLTADFNLPYDASPGLWDLHVDDLSLDNSFTVLEVTPSIVSIDPDAANQGESVTSQVLAEDSHFTVEEPIVSLSFSSDPEEIIYASDVSILSDTELHATFNIPTDASTGKWDVHVGSMILVEGFTVNLLAGLGDLNKNDISIYPNPASEKFSIENVSNATVTIFDSNGSKIASQYITETNKTFDISNLPVGIYLVNIVKDKKLLTSRLIVQ
jgi:plastocyanin